MEGFVRILGKGTKPANGDIPMFLTYEFAFDLSGPPDERWDQHERYVSLKNVEGIKIYRTLESLNGAAITDPVRDCLWNSDTCDNPCTTVPMCSKPNFDHLTNDGCNCPIPKKYFPICIIKLKGKSKKRRRYLVYPTKEERNKLLAPKSTTDLHQAVQDLTNEMRYNPTAGSHVAEARERFEENVSKKRPKK